MKTPSTSGDAIADRRHAYGEACLKARDFKAAAEVFGQAVEAAPNWAAGWYSLGNAHEKAGDRKHAIRAFHTARALDEADVLGAGVRLARLGEDGDMTVGYIAALFDDYADDFDRHLVEKLGYRGPAIIKEAITSACESNGRKQHFHLALDIGCGTGLMAKAIRQDVAAIEGVDASAAMIAKAKLTGCYAENRLFVGGALACLQSQPDNRYDLLMAADVLVYFGDLAPLFDEAQRVMARGALFAFTVQSHQGEGFVLGADLRFHHSESYIAALAADCGFNVAHLSPCVTRRDAGRDVRGSVAVLIKPDV